MFNSWIGGVVLGLGVWWQIVEILTFWFFLNIKYNVKSKVSFKEVLDKGLGSKWRLKFKHNTPWGVHLWTLVFNTCWLSTKIIKCETTQTQCKLRKKTNYTFYDWQSHWNAFIHENRFPFSYWYIIIQMLKALYLAIKCLFKHSLSCWKKKAFNSKFCSITQLHR